jgi:hypothetical protein
LKQIFKPQKAKRRKEGLKGGREEGKEGQRKG